MSKSEPLPLPANGPRESFFETVRELMMVQAEFMTVGEALRYFDMAMAAENSHEVRLVMGFEAFHLMAAGLDLDEDAYHARQI